MKNSTHPAKIVAACTATVFLFSTAMSPVAEANFWSERKKAAAPSTDNQLAQTPAFPARLSSQVQYGFEDLVPQSALASLGAAGWQTQENFLPAGLAELPVSLGKIQDIHSSNNKMADWVVLIQDAHNIQSAQKNLAGILAHMQGHETGSKPLLIGVEGSVGLIDVENFRRFQYKKGVREAADFLLQKALINGAEYHGMTSVKDSLIWGLEDEAAYLANVEAYRASLPLLVEKNDWMREADAAVAALKEKFYSPELVEFDKAIAVYHRNGTGLAAYVTAVAGESGADLERDFSQTAQFLAALALEKELSMNDVAKEREAIVRRLAGKMSESDTERLVKTAAALRAGQIGQGAFYKTFSALLKKNGVLLSETPAFEKYIRYVLTTEKIQPRLLYEELEKLEARAARKLARTPEQAAVVSLSQDMALVGKLSSHELTNAEWDSFAARRAGIANFVSRARSVDASALPGEEKQKVLDKIVDVYASFYEAAVRRNAILVDNLEKQTAADDTNRSVSVLISGGFHTPGLQDELKKKGLSYVTLLPSMEITTGASDYLSFFSPAPTSLQKMFLGDKLFMQPTSGLAARTIGGFEHVSRMVRVILNVIVAPLCAAADGVSLDDALAAAARELGMSPDSIAEVQPQGSSRAFRIVDGDKVFNLILTPAVEKKDAIAHGKAVKRMLGEFKILRRISNQIDGETPSFYVTILRERTPAGKAAVRATKAVAARIGSIIKGVVVASMAGLVIYYHAEALVLIKGIAALGGVTIVVGVVALLSAAVAGVIVTNRNARIKAGLMFASAFPWAGVAQTVAPRAPYQEVSAWSSSLISTQVDEGNRPAIKVDVLGRKHMVYSRSDGSIVYRNPAGVEAVVQGPNPSAGMAGADFPELTLDASGNPHIVYGIFNGVANGTTRVTASRYAYLNGSQWVIEDIPAARRIGKMSLAFDLRGQPLIAYATTEGDIKQLVRAGNGWGVETIREAAHFSDSDLVYTAPHILIDSTGIQRIFYVEERLVRGPNGAVSLDVDSLQLVFVANTGRSGWSSPETVGKMAPYGYLQSNYAAALDRLGQPHAVFFGPNGVAYSQRSPNGVWSPEIVEAGAAGQTLVGLGASIVVTADDVVHLSYNKKLSATRAFELRYATREAASGPWTIKTVSQGGYNPSNVNYLTSIGMTADGPVFLWQNGAGLFLVGSGVVTNPRVRYGDLTFASPDGKLYVTLESEAIPDPATMRTREYLVIRDKATDKLIYEEVVPPSVSINRNDLYPVFQFTADSRYLGVAGTDRSNGNPGTYAVYDLNSTNEVRKVLTVNTNDQGQPFHIRGIKELSSTGNAGRVVLTVRAVLNGGEGPDQDITRYFTNRIASGDLRFTSPDGKLTVTIESDPSVNPATMQTAQYVAVRDKVTGQLIYEEVVPPSVSINRNNLYPVFQFTTDSRYLGVASVGRDNGNPSTYAIYDLKSAAGVQKVLTINATDRGLPFRIRGIKELSSTGNAGRVVLTVRPLVNGVEGPEEELTRAFIGAPGQTNLVKASPDGSWALYSYQRTAYPPARNSAARASHGQVLWNYTVESNASRVQAGFSPDSGKMGVLITFSGRGAWDRYVVADKTGVRVLDLQTVENNNRFIVENFDRDISLQNDRVSITYTVLVPNPAGGLNVGGKITRTFMFYAFNPANLVQVSPDATWGLYSYSQTEYPPARVFEARDNAGRGLWRFTTESNVAQIYAGFSSDGQTVGILPTFFGQGAWNTYRVVGKNGAALLNLETIDGYRFVVGTPGQNIRLQNGSVVITYSLLFPNQAGGVTVGPATTRTFTFGAATANPANLLAPGAAQVSGVHGSVFMNATPAYVIFTVNPVEIPATADRATLRFDLAKPPAAGTNKLTITYASVVPQMPASLRLMAADGGVLQTIALPYTSARYVPLEVNLTVPANQIPQIARIDIDIPKASLANYPYPQSLLGVTDLHFSPAAASVPANLVRADVRSGRMLERMSLVALAFIGLTYAASLFDPNTMALFLGQTRNLMMQVGPYGMIAVLFGGSFFLFEVTRLVLPIFLLVVNELPHFGGYALAKLFGRADGARLVMPPELFDVQHHGNLDFGLEMRIYGRGWARFIHGLPIPVHIGLFIATFFMPWQIGSVIGSLCVVTLPALRSDFRTAMPRLYYAAVAPLKQKWEVLTGRLDKIDRKVSTDLAAEALLHDARAFRHARNVIENLTFEKMLQLTAQDKAPAGLSAPITDDDKRDYLAALGQSNLKFSTKEELERNIARFDELNEGLWRLAQEVAKDQAGDKAFTYAGALSRLAVLTGSIEKEFPAYGQLIRPFVIRFAEELHAGGLPVAQAPAFIEKAFMNWASVAKGGRVVPQINLDQDKIKVIDLRTVSDDYIDAVDAGLRDESKIKYPVATFIIVNPEEQQSSKVKRLIEGLTRTWADPTSIMIATTEKLADLQAIDQAGVVSIKRMIEGYEADKQYSDRTTSNGGVKLSARMQTSGIQVCAMDYSLLDLQGIFFQMILWLTRGLVFETNKTGDIEKFMKTDEMVRKQA